MSLAENKVLSGRSGDDGSLRILAFMKVDERSRWDYASRFSEDAKKLLLEVNDDAALRKARMLPVGSKWASRPGVTVVVDATHVMSPFAGMGVNVALMDALELAQEWNAVAKSGQDISYVSGDGGANIGAS